MLWRWSYLTNTAILLVAVIDLGKLLSTCIAMLCPSRVILALQRVSERRSKRTFWSLSLILYFLTANFSTGLLSQGACVSAAGQGPENATSASLSIIDGFGLTQSCTNDEGYSSPSRICNCNGPLPEYGWGRKIENRNPCGLNKKADKAWIAAPVIGGLALFVAVCGMAYVLWGRRTADRQQQQQQPSRTAAQDVPLSFLAAIKSNTQRLAGRLSHRSNAGWDASTPSQTSLESGDSGGDLIRQD